MSTTRTVAPLVDGERGESGATQENRNPAALDEVVATVHLADAGTFVKPCSRAKAAQSAWAAVPAPIRGRAIQQVGRIVEANKDALSRLITREIGKPYAEALGEVQEVIDTC